MASTTRWILLALAVVFVLYLSSNPSFADAQQTTKDMCNMCNQINMGGSKAKKYLCPQKYMKSGECQINLNGNCCADSKKHPKCIACDAQADSADEEDEDDEE